MPPKSIATRFAFKLVAHCAVLLRIGNLLLSILHGRTVLFNKEVHGQPEYFADGVLVHNCPQCLPLDGQVFTIKEARGLIPRHVNCRCSWASVPADDVKKGAAKAQRKAVRESVARDGGTAKSGWAGSKRQSIVGPAPVKPRKASQDTLDAELGAIRKDRGLAPLPSGAASQGPPPRR